MKLSDLKLGKIRKIIKFEVDGEQKEITVLNAIGKKRENLLKIVEIGNQLDDKSKATDMIYKGILKELVDVDIDVKNTLTLGKAPSLSLLELNHEISEILYEVQYEFITNQIRMINSTRIATLSAIGVDKAESMEKDIEELKNANI